MIIELTYSNSGWLLVPVGTKPEVLQDLLLDAFPNTSTSLVCVDGYMNGVSIDE